MKVLALVSDAYGGRGGIALYNRNVLRALCDHPRAEHVVAVPRLVEGPLPPTMPANLEFITASHGSKPRFVLETARAVLRRGPIDLLVVSHVNLLPVVEVLRRLVDLTTMLFVYGIDAWTKRDRLTPRLLEGVDACVSIRQLTIDRLRVWSPMRSTQFHVLENAIALDAYGAGPRPAYLCERYGIGDEPILLTLARLDDRRFGQDEVLDAMPRLLDEIPSLKYLVVGSGSQERAFRDKADRLGVGDHVVFTGAVSNEEKADHYRLADAFAMPGSHPTEYDRYPLRFVFLEAMACGLPVVASRPEELTDPSDSPIPNIYVDPNDPSELVEGLLQALRQGPGPVPEELARYGFPSFRTRLHGIVDELLG